MSLFILFYLLIYGGAHAYLVTRTVRAFHLSAACAMVLALVALLMIAAPILVRVLEHAGRDAPARVAAASGYLWMGFFFLFLSASIFLDLARSLVLLAGWLLRRDLWWSDQHLLSLSLVLALVTSVYGLCEARRLKVEQVTLKSPRVPKSVEGVRVVQISDLHLGLMVGKARLKEIVDDVAALKPDLIVSTGDLVDGQMDGLRGLEAELAALEAPLGKYAVLGNHEALAGLDPSVEFTAKSGFRLLRQESVAAGEFMIVAGVDDPFVARGEKGAGDGPLLSSLPREKYILFLKHRPKVDADAADLFDLQLSGHVHKGQIFPFNLITRLVYPLPTGLSRVGSGSFVYVSRGSGTWGPPMRVLAPPEITVIDILSS